MDDPTTSGSCCAADDCVIGDGKGGLSRAVAYCAPHVTLMYGDRFVAEQSLEMEVGWAVHELVLVHSLLGRSCYRCLHGIPLDYALVLTSENMAP